MSDEYEVLRNLIYGIGRAIIAVVAVLLVVLLVLFIEVQGYGPALVDWVGRLV